MAELIKATELTKLHIEEEIGEDVVVHGMVRTYIMPGLYALNRHKHGPSPLGRVWCLIREVHSGCWAIVVVDEEYGLIVPATADTLAQAQQIALLELHR